MLKKGDPCYVRHEGKIEKVDYLRTVIGEKKWHWVKLKNGDPKIVNRFVCMTGIKGKDNEKQS